MREGHILLVEDNEDDVELTLRAFRKSKLKNEIRVVRDGAEALEYLRAEGAHSSRDRDEIPELVLLDLKLPKVDGIGVLEAIKDDPRTKTIPIVVLTTSDTEQDMKRCYELGANSYVRKPVDFREFVDAVQHLGVYWVLYNERPPAGAR